MEQTCHPDPLASFQMADFSFIITTSNIMLRPCILLVCSMNTSTYACLAHSLNPKWHNNNWLNGRLSRKFPSHMDGEISQGRKDAFRQIY